MLSRATCATRLATRRIAVATCKPRRAARTMTTGKPEKPDKQLVDVAEEIGRTLSSIEKGLDEIDKTLTICMCMATVSTSAFIGAIWNRK